MAQSVDLFSMQNPRRGTRRFGGSTRAAARARRAPAPAAPAPAPKKRRARRAPAPAAPVSAGVQETTNKSLFTPWLGGINKQFYDLMAQFEQDFKKMSVYGSSTKTKENYKHWPDHVYTDGKANQLFQAYLWGYWNGKGFTDTRSNPDLVQTSVRIQIFATRNERARAFVESLPNGALKKALLIGLSKTMDALMADVTVFDMPDFLQTIRHILARQIPNKPKWSAVRAQLLGFFDDREINPSDREIYTRNLKKHARIANKLHDTVKNYYAYLYKGDKEAILKDLKFYFEFTLFDDFRRWYKGSQEKYFGDYLQDEIKRWEGSLLLRQKERESNPSVKAIYEKFNGRPSRRSRNVAAPAGTPRDLAQLGRLRTLKTVDGRTWRFPGDRAPFLAADSRGKLHIVGGQYRANPAGEDCGEIDLIEYQTRKPHLGHHKETIYYHKLGEDTGERPTLKITPEGELVIHGGAYRIESDGIHN